MENTITNARALPMYCEVALIYQATLTLARRVKIKNDPVASHLADLMIETARSAYQMDNKKHETIINTLERLSSDLEAFIMDCNGEVWGERDFASAALQGIEIERAYTGRDDRHGLSLYLNELRNRLARDLENEDCIYSANAIIVMIDRAIDLLNICKPIKKTSSKASTGSRYNYEASEFENARTTYQKRPQYQEALNRPFEAPRCPKCGSEMVKRIAKKGPMAGHPFWACTGYPNCKGTAKCEE